MRRFMDSIQKTSRACLVCLVPWRP
jgi:hypothetical protein